MVTGVEDVFSPGDAVFGGAKHPRRRSRVSAQGHRKPQQLRRSLAGPKSGGPGGRRRTQLWRVRFTQPWPSHHYRRQLPKHQAFDKLQPQWLFGLWLTAAMHGVRVIQALNAQHDEDAKRAHKILAEAEALLLANPSTENVRALRPSVAGA